MLETILPFLRPIEHLIMDPDISEIMVNGNGTIFYQWNGHLHQSADVVIEQNNLRSAAKRIARLLGQDISEDKPLLDARLADGSRVNVTFPPTALGGVEFNIRKFKKGWFTMAQLVEAGALPESLAEQLGRAVANKETILVCGATDSGKTTFTKALLDFIPLEERIVVIEDTIELQLRHKNVSRLEARQEQRGPEGEITVPAITIRDLVKTSLRKRPDRIILGEVRGGEAFDLLDAIGTGHTGSVSTLHANSALQGLTRLASMAMRAGVEIPHVAIKGEIGDLIDLVVHLETRDHVRRVSEVIRVNAFDHDRNVFDYDTLFLTTNEI